MKIYRIAKQYEKHPRETKDFITLYHVSKDRITRFSPKSNFKGHMGCYFSPSYRSAIIDWADVIKARRNKNHPAKIRANEIMVELDGMVEGENETREKELWEELAKCNKSIEKSEKDEKNFYHTLYLHKVSFPKSTYKQCMDWFYGFMEREKQEKGDINFGFWGWGAQVFIPAELLNQIQIISVTELSEGEFIDEYKNTMRRKPHYPDSLYPKKQ